MEIQTKHAKKLPSKLQVGQLFQDFWPPETLKALP